MTGIDRFESGTTTLTGEQNLNSKEYDSFSFSC